MTAVTSSASSIHADALTTFPCCNKCAYSHPVNKCPTKGHTCYTCGGHNHYTALCIQKKHRKSQQSGNTQRRGYQSTQRSHSRHHGCHTSCLPNRQSVASPTVPPTALPIPCLPAGLTDPINSRPPSGTSRTT